MVDSALKENMGDALNYLEDGMQVEVVIYNGRPISVEIPQTVVREIAYTEPAVRGDTSGKVLKPAKLNTISASSNSNKQITAATVQPIRTNLSLEGLVD